MTEKSSNYNFDKIFKILSEYRSPSIHIHDNCSCLSCNCIEKQMVRIRSLHFCFDCAESIFNISKDSDPVYNQNKKYKKWLSVKQRELDEAYKK